jgi:hypothetical protein
VPSAESLLAYVVCPPGRVGAKVHVLGQGHHVLKIPTTCTLNTDNFSFKPANSFDIRDYYITRPLAHFDISLETLKAPVHVNVSHVYDPQLLTKEDLSRLTTTHRTDALHISLYLFLGLIAIVSLSAGGLWACTQYRSRRRRQPSESIELEDRCPTDKLLLAGGEALLAAASPGKWLAGEHAPGTHDQEASQKSEKPFDYAH